MKRVIILAMINISSFSGSLQFATKRIPMCGLALQEFKEKGEESILELFAIPINLN
jgi:hypothetical protein